MHQQQQQQHCLATTTALHFIARQNLKDVLCSLHSIDHSMDTGQTDRLILRLVSLPVPSMARQMLQVCTKSKAHIWVVLWLAAGESELNTCSAFHPVSSESRASHRTVSLPNSWRQVNNSRALFAKQVTLCIPTCT